MNPSLAIPTLPNKYEQVLSVRSMGLRVALSNAIMTVVGLIKRHRHFEVDVRAAALINRYFDFLAASMRDEAVINKRGSWLLRYTQVVEINLLKNLAKLENKGESFEDVNPHLTTYVFEMVFKVYQYCSTKNTSVLIHDTLITVVDDIVTLSRTIKSDPEAFAYRDILESIATVNTEVDGLLAIGVAYDQGQEDAIVASLRAIQYAMKSYSLRQSNVMT
jgi:hypothetical protein